MNTVYDFATLVVFAALAAAMVRMIRHAREWGLIELAECLAVACGCALVNSLGNAGHHATAGLALVLLAFFVWHLNWRAGRTRA